MGYEFGGEAFAFAFLCSLRVSEAITYTDHCASIEEIRAPKKKRLLIYLPFNSISKDFKDVFNIDGMQALLED